MIEVNPGLLADLARLAGRYPPEDWRALIDWMEDPGRRRELALVLDELAAASRRRRDKSAADPASGRPPSVPQKIDALRATDPERAALLEDLWQRLRTRELFPDMGTLRAFAESVGMKGFRATKRDQAVAGVLRHLAELPRADLHAALARPVTNDASRSGEYERWVQLILGRTAGDRDAPSGDER